MYVYIYVNMCTAIGNHDSVLQLLSSVYRSPKLKYVHIINVELKSTYMYALLKKKKPRYMRDVYVQSINAYKSTEYIVIYYIPI
jgi:hypothetical protein